MDNPAQFQAINMQTLLFMFQLPSMITLLLFQKAEADLQYVEKKLESDFMVMLPEHASAEENPVKLLEKLSAVKSRHKALCAQMQEIALEQKNSISAMQSHLNTAIHILQKLEQSTSVEIPPLTEQEKQAAVHLKCEALPSGNTDTTNTSAEPQNTIQEQHATVEPEFEPIREEALRSVPRSIRSSIQISELNTFYRQLYEHFRATENSPVNMMQMKKLKMGVNDAKLKILKYLSVIEMDTKGLVWLPSQE
ncbi:spindle and kinetochore-associated protein 2 isoform X2 [Erpetoichthys calabaricus]|uniref:spindle and kinetochore-associated protein 2 isoform X2 n=1 Tax=Erpetoichthys calabaricus TaxID=27687 RepID=UPI00223451D6|nr:spindle and kinetochore-associated protein 2 isoform X2 [Erpetoichthys calabaricus]